MTVTSKVPPSKPQKLPSVMERWKASRGSCDPVGQSSPGCCAELVQGVHGHCGLETSQQLLVPRIDEEMRVNSE